MTVRQHLPSPLSGCRVDQGRKGQGNEVSMRQAAEDLPVQCLNCGTPRHNRRTCCSCPPARQTPELLPVETNNEGEASN
jgi:hypothetical protein